MNDYDWLDLSDNRGGGPTHTALTPTTDVNAGFDQVAALFEAYPEAAPSEKVTALKKRGGKKGRKTNK